MVVVILVVVLVAVALAFDFGGGGSEVSDSKDRIFATNDPVERACALDEKILLRIWQGYHPDRSEDIVMVPQRPNYTGTFNAVNHSGPWNYLTNVPLVLYGPEQIASRGRARTPSNITDIYATAGALTDVDLPRRAGRVLSDALRSEATEPPRLIFTLVWDGVGRNVLEEWPDAWPTLAGLERTGTSFVNASVGSSPTITPAVHASLGTGSFPRSHGVTGIFYKGPNGRITQAFSERATTDLRLTTFADEIDQAYGNQSKVGLVASRSWHMGMLGHGSRIEGGDEDQLGIFRDELIGATSGYTSPQSLLDSSWSRLDEHGDQVDRSDGEADGEWLGEPVLTGDLRANPAWVMHETDAILQMIEGEGYGADSIPDMLFANIKMADTVGHNFLMDSEEMNLVLQSLDDSLRRIVDHLDEEVGDYVLILTADHGHTLPAARTKAWPVRVGVLVEDIDSHFDVPNGQSLIERSVAVGLFLNRPVMRALGVDAGDIARYVNSYTVRDNWPEGDLPEGYESRGEEHVFSAAWETPRMDDVMRCAFGSNRPPKSLDG